MSRAGVTEISSMSNRIHDPRDSLSHYQMIGSVTLLYNQQKSWMMNKKSRWSSFSEISRIIKETMIFMMQKCSEMSVTTDKYKILSDIREEKEQENESSKQTSESESNELFHPKCEVESEISAIVPNSKKNTCKKGISSDAKYQVSTKETRSRMNQESDSQHKYELKYKCEHCGSGYPVKSYLDKHRLIHSKKHPHMCTVCKKYFHAKSLLEKHKKTHLLGKGSYECKFCDRKYIQYRSLLLHHWVHRDDNPYKCKICEHACTGANAMYAHMRKHTGEKPFKCEICGKTYVRRSQLRRHMDGHLGVVEKAFLCQECGKDFITMCALKAHTASHRSETPYLCDFCGKGFKYRASLRQHKNLHAARRPLFKCDVCKKLFNSDNYLKAHRRTHISERAYKCEICGNDLREQLQLATHMWVHKDERPHKCDLCGEKLSVDDPFKNTQGNSPS